MSSNTSQSNQAPHHQNRVSLGASEGTTVQLAESRKRKPEEELESNESSSSSESESDDSSAAVPNTDEEMINLIITKRLLSKDVKVIKEAMKSLVTMMHSPSNVNFAENRKIAVRRGAPIIIVLAMRRNKTSAEIQDSGCRALSLITLCKIGTKASVSHDIIAIGGLKCCIFAMEQHSDKSIVQARGCHLIRNLWWLPAIRDKVVGEGGLKAVVNAMKNHEHGGFVQRSGCQALKTLLGGQEFTCAQEAAELRCIDLVITAMNNHPNNDNLQEYGCEFLSRLSHAHEKYRTMIIHAHGISPVGEALRIHDGNNKVKLAAHEALKAIIGA